MSLVLSIARFELAQRTRRLSSLAYFVAFFAIGFLAQVAAGGAFSSVTVGVGAGGKIFVNSPFQIHVILSIFSYFGMIVTAAVFGQAICQDYETNSQALFFTTPMSERSYLAGRFLGALGFAILVHLCLGAGMWAASFMPFVQQAQFEHAHASYYLWPYVVTVIPNLVILGSIFFAMAAFGKKMMPVYVSAVVLFMAYLSGNSLLDKIENRTISALVDPFSGNAIGVFTQYFSVAEKNSRLIPLRGVVLANRAIWLGASLVLLAVAAFRFRFGDVQRSGGAPEVKDEAAPVLPTGRVQLGASTFAQLLRLIALNFTETVRQTHFIVIVLAAALFTLVAASQSGVMFGTNVFPVTYNVLDIVAGSFQLFALVLATIYAGELVWRERDVRVDQLLDTMPTKTWLPFVGKLGALFIVQVLLVVMLMVCGLGFQTAKGYHHYELGLYVKDLFGVHLIDYWLVCVLAMFVHTIVQQKYLGHLVMVVYWIFLPFMNKLGLEQRLYKYGSTPSWEYSDMNGFGHFMKGVFWFDLYWSLCAVLMAIACSLLWVRGTAMTGRSRLSLVRARFSPGLRVVTGLVLVAFVGVGGFIYYNTNVLNHWKTSHDEERQSADYEKKYKHTADEPQPRITGIDVHFDLDPYALTADETGTFKLENKTSQPITRVYVSIDEELEVKKLLIGGVAPSNVDKHLGVYTVTLPQPMAPGATSTMELELFHATRGFRNDSQPSRTVYNGTFISSEALPTIGYNEDGELSDEGSRKKLGLPAKERMRDLNDPVGRRNNVLRADADWVDFAATVCTAPDQIAVAPGYLQKEWSENGRRCFRYEMDSKMLAFYSILSARYAVKRDTWNDVKLEIYYQPGHEYNLDAMMSSMKDALAYYTTKLGPYPHHQARILEFPRYEEFAQSFPNTIPFSEGIGFIAKVDPNDKDDLDYPFYVTAHEMAHQWWGHQEVGANVQGASMLIETLAQYSALMVMKKRFGPAHMKRFLRYELDSYLQGRSTERKKELPLYRVENQQYIHYAKGSLVMYALQDYLGEDVVDRVLSEYVAAVKFQQPPYTISTDLVERFRAAAPPELEYIVKDLFETITLYDNRATKAEVKKRGDGKYDVTLELKSGKLRANELGVEDSVPMDDLVDIGALDDKGDATFIEKRKLHAGDQTVTFTVDKLPAKVGVDPINKLIDRVPDDNVVVPTIVD